MKCRKGRDRILRWLEALAVAVSLQGCGHSDSEVKVDAPKDLVGRSCAVVVGSMMGDMTLKVQPGIGIEWFNDYTSGIEAVRLGKVAAMPLDFFFARRWARLNPDDFAITKPYHSIPWGFFFPKGSALRAKVAPVLERMRTSGDLDRIIAKWTEAEDAGTVAFEPVDAEGYAGRAGTLRFAMPGDREPVCFARADGFVGFDIDILRQVARALDMKLEIVPVTMGALVPAVQSGKADMGGGGTAITAERAEKVDFSECYYRVPTVFLIRRALAVEREKSCAADFKAASGLFASLKDSFVRTFVTEERWKMMANGLGITLLITLLASLFGTLLAFPVALMRMSRQPVLVALGRGYVCVLQGTPVLVLLMVLYYIVFGSVNVDGIWVAVLGFALNASAYIGEALRSGVESVPAGQTEAALALGYSPRAAFLRFVLPQAVRTVLPVYRGELISLLKATSVVGYIAICDLNKASDLIRSRTYESFFPILTTAFVYFLAAWSMASLVDAMGRRLDPAARRGKKGGLK